VTNILPLLGSRAVLTRVLLSCYALTGLYHLAVIALSTLLPFHLVELGGSRTQVGLLFSATTVVSMVLRPVIGGLVDLVGARRVILPGIVLMAGTSLALHVPRSPEAVIAVMVVAGIGSGLISMTANILAVRASPTEHRGEALSLYYLASSLAIAVAPPMAFGLRNVGGMSLAFIAVTVLVVMIFVLVTSMPGSIMAPAPGVAPGFRALSPGAVPVSCSLALITVGHSSIYAFLPLYAVSRGHGTAVVWFFTVYSFWLIVCRALLGRASDRVGRTRVLLPAMTVTALAYFTLALPLTPASLMLGGVLLGTGGAVLYPTLAALVVDRAPDGERGLALGTLSGSWDLGVVVGSSLVGFVADRISFAAGFATAGVAAGLGTLVFLATSLKEKNS
jgi:MFS family permease